jgi:hypothetical protein
MAEIFFEYQLKGGLVIAVSVIAYILFFAKDQFLARNRFYLLSSLFATCIIPLMAMPLWIKNILFGKADVTIDTLPLVVINGNTNLQQIIPPQNSFSWEITALYIYGFISFILLIRLAWAYIYIIRLKQKAEIFPYEGLKLAIVRDKQISPFSFFRTIFLPKELESSTDKRLVLAHEKAHSDQWHSIDILLAECMLVFQWWNPFAWWLRKLIAQNHDYCVDRTILKQVSEPKQYQYSLIKVLSGKNQIQLVNNFNKNLTKKRIIMMNKSNTNKTANRLKGFLIIPLVAVLFLAFTNPDKTQNDTLRKELTDKLKIENPINSINFSDTKKIENKKTKIPISTKNKEIQKIRKITSEIKKKIKGVVISKETHKPIEGVKIYNKFGEVLATSNNKGKFSFTFVTNPKIPIEHQGETLFIKKGFQMRHYKIDLEGSGKISIEIEAKVESLPEKKEDTQEIEGYLNTVLINSKSENNQPLYIIDGRVSTPITASSLNPYAIESISILRNKTATTLYGEKAKDGVIIVNLKPTTKDNKNNPLTIIDKDNPPLFIINEKVVEEKAIKDLDSNTIKSINVLKGKLAIEKYGKKGENGVVVIELKEK